jgi:hypothetical protein
MLKGILKLMVVLSVIFGAVVVALALLGPSIGNVFSPVVSDNLCFWLGAAQAWVDVNENGVKDTDEPPLSGVKFTLVDVSRRETIRDTGISDDNGKVYFFMRGEEDTCPGPFDVYAESPSGYYLTTPGRISAQGHTEWGFNQRHPEEPRNFFGFNYFYGAPTVNP